MSDSVLFGLCIAIAVIVLGILEFSKMQVSYMPAVAAVVRSNRNCYGVIVALLYALWVWSKFATGILPGFGVVLFGLFLLISVTVAVTTHRYALKHLLARI